jgi:6-phospho-beta-glucosidase
VLVNFTNPSGIVTEAVLKYSSITSVGLCNIPIGLVMETVERTGCAMEDVRLDYVGLNHLAWVRGVRIGDKDITREAIDTAIEKAGEEWTVEPVAECMREAMKSLQMICNPYLQYFYATDAIMAHLKGKEKTRGEEVVEVEQSLFEKYKQQELSEKPEELSKRGGAHYSTAAFHLIAAIENDSQSPQVVCCRNNGAIPTFDADVSVEVTAIIGKDGATAIPQEAPSPAIRGLMQAVKSYESLTVEAAVTGNRETAFQALLENPLTPNAVKTRQLLDEVLEINKPHLQGTFF